MNEVASAFLPAGRQVLPTISFIVPNKWGRYKYKNFDSAIRIPQSAFDLESEVALADVLIFKEVLAGSA
jgi:hypothetical protein